MWRPLAFCLLLTGCQLLNGADDYTIDNSSATGASFSLTTGGLPAGGGGQGAASAGDGGQGAASAGGAGTGAEGGS